MFRMERADAEMPAVVRAKFSCSEKISDKVSSSDKLSSL